MLLYDILRLSDPAFDPGKAKIHLASWNGHHEPLDVYVAGEFDEWQRWQNKKNFERAFVLSLISVPKAPHRWLFAGVHESSGREYHEDRGYYRYDLTELPAFADLNGRVFVHFPRPGRASYLLADKWESAISVSEIRPERLTIGDFPGYKAVDISRTELGAIVGHAPDSWRMPLSSVAGVYLISDTTTGKLYVGSATGEGGIWQRWCDYAATGHGGNAELQRLLRDEGDDRQTAFRYSVLEIADTHASHADILEREAHWKRVLMTRQHGWNAN